MAEHYYTSKPESPHQYRTIEARALGFSLAFETDSGVFSRDGLDPGSKLLIEAAPPIQTRALDLGCGWGAIGVFLAKANPGAEIVLSDINERAVALAQKNLRKNGVANARAVVSDGYAAVDGPFECIFTNPPIRTGKQAIYALFDGAKAQLMDGGALYVVIRKQQGAPSALKHLGEVFGSAEVIDRGGGYWVIRAEKRDGSDAK